MSGRLVGMVLDHCPAPPHQKLMLAAIAEHADDEGYAWPSMERLGIRCGVTPRTAQRTIAQLEDGGWIKAHHSRGRHSNQYWINLAALANPGTRVRVNPDAHVRVQRPQPRRGRHPNPDVGVTPTLTPTSSEPSRTVIEPPRPGVSPPPNGRRPTLTPEATHHHAAVARAILAAKARPPPHPP